MTDLTPIVTPVVADPGMAIVTTPTKIAPLTASDGAVYVVQVMNAANVTITPTNAATWTHNADGSLDIYAANACLVASFPSGQWSNVQLIQVSPAAEVTQ